MHPFIPFRRCFSILLLAHLANSNAEFQPPSFFFDQPLTGNKVQRVLEHQPKTSLSHCNLTGPIETTQCAYETLESVNDELHNSLHELVRTPFFKYLKIDLNRACPFWEANGFCVLKDCVVTTVDETDIPVAWRTECLGRLNRPPADQIRKYLPGCYYRDSDFCVLDDDQSKDGEYVDLTINPERFTGYSGPAAHRVWGAIYDENCFGIAEADFHANIGRRDTDSNLLTSSFGTSPASLSHLVQQAHEVEMETCLEKRVFYRIISGLHASISTHICRHSFDQRTGTWASSLQCFVDRIASHPERLQYIYFNAVLLLRALARAGSYLAAFDIYTGVGVEANMDKATSQLLDSVIRIAREVGKFDEGSLFKDEDAKHLKEEFKIHFRNVTRIMDCVGCDKCKLWGKVQTSGLGTALKILFELDERALNPSMNPNLLQRSEIVTLINTLHQFSESLQSVNEFRKMWAAVEHAPHGKEVTEQGFIPSMSSDFQTLSQLPPRDDQVQLPASSWLQGVVQTCRRCAASCLDVGARVTHKVMRTIAALLRLVTEPSEHTRAEL